jgi:tRNA/tmRNA/rRNA uracil-C5-methylase (TrmA/RlmC/RlmD family)
MLEYQKQMEYKENLLKDLFREHLDIYSGMEAAESSTGYRNKVFMPVGSAGYGIYARYSHEIVAHNQLPKPSPNF